MSSLKKFKFFACSPVEIHGGLSETPGKVLWQRAEWTVEILERKFHDVNVRFLPGPRHECCHHVPTAISVEHFDALQRSRCA